MMLVELLCHKGKSQPLNMYSLFQFIIFFSILLNLFFKGKKRVVVVISLPSISVILCMLNICCNHFVGWLKLL